MNEDLPFYKNDLTARWVVCVLVLLLQLFVAESFVSSAVSGIFVSIPQIIVFPTRL